MSHPSLRCFKTSSRMCCPSISVGSKSQLQASCPLALNASRTIPENSQAIKTFIPSLRWRGRRLQQSAWGLYLFCNKHGKYIHAPPFRLSRNSLDSYSQSRGNNHTSPLSFPFSLLWGGGSETK